MKVLMRSILGMVCAAALFAATSATQAASLSYFEPTRNGVAWTWFDTARNKHFVVHVFEQTPTALYWEQGGEGVLALSGRNILSFDAHSGKSRGIDMPLPSLMDGEVPVGLWRDTASKRLRMATRYVVPAKHVTGPHEAPQLHDAAGKPLDGLATPEWGDHVILNVYERNRSSWRVVATMPTKMFAGDTPGLSVLKPYWHEDGYSSTHLLASKRCHAFGGLFRGRTCHLGDDEEARTAFYEVAFPQCVGNVRGCPIDAVGKVTCDGCTYDLFHASILGDQLHGAFPIYLRLRETGKFTPLDDSVDKAISGEDGAQVLIAVSGHYAVLETRRAGSPNHISVIDLSSGELTLHTQGQKAMWLPW